MLKKASQFKNNKVKYFGAFENYLHKMIQINSWKLLVSQTDLSSAHLQTPAPT